MLNLLTEKNNFIESLFTCKDINDLIPVPIPKVPEVPKDPVVDSNDNYLQYRCNACEYNTDRKYCYKRHLQSTKHASNLNPIKTKKKTKQEKEHLCKKCGKIFKHQPSLSRHQKNCRIQNGGVRLNQILELKREMSELRREIMKEKEEELKCSKRSTVENVSYNININVPDESDYNLDWIFDGEESENLQKELEA